MVLAGGRGERLYPLTRDRAKPAVPFGALYRIIDYTLSNVINSGFRRIHILTQYKANSLIRHIHQGWNIFSQEFGEFINVIPAQQMVDEQWYQGTADAIFQNLYFIEQERPDFVIILAGDHIYKMNYNALLDFHIQKEADLSIAAIEVPKEKTRQLGVIEKDSNDRAVGFQEKPDHPKTIPEKPDMALASMGIYIFSTEILVRRVIEDARDPGSVHDFGKNIIPGMIHSNRVFIFNFVDEVRGEAGYWRDIGTISAYYEANMDLISPKPQFDLYDSDWPIRTYQRQIPPAKMIVGEQGGRREAGLAVDSVISGGCVIKGGEVRRSLLGPGVFVDREAEINDSIIMANVSVGRGARIRRAIVDKGAQIPPRFTIGYNPEGDSKLFTVDDQNIVVVPRNMRME